MNFSHYYFVKLLILLIYFLIHGVNFFLENFNQFMVFFISLFKSTILLNVHYFQIGLHSIFINYYLSEFVLSCVDHSVF